MATELEENWNDNNMKEMLSVTIQELKNILDNNNISADEYEIPGMERHHLPPKTARRRKMAVWFEERAEKSMQTLHNTEESACYSLLRYSIRNLT
ncbi:hypothetical protein LQZ18_13975 [Lachnospiraceae bacterium ZAX-1]